jgi:tetratricopeptide (TPR) repeat protein
MGNEERHNLKKGRTALRFGIAFAFLFALTWSLPSFFTWTFLAASGYSFFLYWFYQPRREMFQRTGEFEFRTVNPAERIEALVRRIVRIIGIAIAGLFMVFFVVRIFSEQSATTELAADDNGFVELNEAASLNELGYNFYLNKQYDSALYYYERALTLEPGNGAVWLNRGMVYYDREQMDKALEAFTRAYESGIQDAFLFHVLGYLHDNGGNTTRAIDFYKEAVGLDSSRADIYSRLAELEPSQAARYQALEEKWRN